MSCATKTVEPMNFCLVCIVAGVGDQYGVDLLSLSRYDLGRDLLFRHILVVLNIWSNIVIWVC